MYKIIIYNKHLPTVKCSGCVFDASTPYGIVGSVLKFMVPSLFQYFSESLENGVCKYLCQSVKTIN